MVALPTKPIDVRKHFGKVISGHLKVIFYRKFFSVSKMNKAAENPDRVSNNMQFNLMTCGSLSRLTVSHSDVPLTRKIPKYIKIIDQTHESHKVIM